MVMFKFCKEMLKEWENEKVFPQKYENASNENEKSWNIQYKNCSYRTIEEISNNIHAISAQQKPMKYEDTLIVCCSLLSMPLHVIVSSEFLCLLIPCKHYIAVNKPLSLSFSHIVDNVNMNLYETSPML